jgi:hypothetical protein
MFVSRVSGLRTATSKFALMLFASSKWLARQN